MPCKPDYGRRLIASRIVELAKYKLDNIWISTPSSKSVNGFTDFTWAGANVIDCASYWIKSTFGRGQGQSMIAYVGPLDIRYLILIVAAIETGYMLFPISPRLSSEDRICLLQDTDCHIFLYTGTTPIDNIEEKWCLSVVVVPEPS
ncbi:hypothetical protein ABVK25_010015 [Lepraria finkii]|uniref:AMP-dependent synthetase/ligase domain-containing protein n=1 Tax=Lepraria finkii TaxID=1340010 RepID=A0ABR4AVU4_9LECA